MRKLLLGAAMLLFAQFGFGQAVTDQAVIPVSITLNSILRLTIVSGGNIEFVVNTLDQYRDGIENTSGTTTTFTVASSVDFDVTLSSEDATFIGTDDATHTLPLGNVGFVISESGGGADPANWDLVYTTVEPLAAGPITIITGVDGAAAGDAVQNRFSIEWELATPTLRVESTLGTLLSQNVQPDRYVTNTFINLVAK